MVSLDTAHKKGRPIGSETKRGREGGGEGGMIAQHRWKWGGMNRGNIVRMQEEEERIRERVTINDVFICCWTREPCAAPRWRPREREKERERERRERSGKAGKGKR